VKYRFGRRQWNGTIESRGKVGTEGGRVAKMPVMVTGNPRRIAGMVAALEAGELDMIDIGQPTISDPLAASKILN
jgi:2,4-dienoyl-CoA reductase-like NADH-dependent reductase (Old Yellow Enzyme family)